MRLEGKIACYKTKVQIVPDGTQKCTTKCYVLHIIIKLHPHLLYVSYVVFTAANNLETV